MNRINVEVRELKAKLDHYLERAAEGEVVRITERGRPKAILAPLPGADRVEVGLREGWISAGAGVGAGEPPSPAPAFHPREELSSADLLAQDHGA